MSETGAIKLDHYRLLGRSGLRVSPLCLGTMTFGNEWGWGADKEESRRMLDLYLERGGNFSATVLSPPLGWRSETSSGCGPSQRRSSLPVPNRVSSSFSTAA